MFVSEKPISAMREIFIIERTPSIEFSWRIFRSKDRTFL